MHMGARHFFFRQDAVPRLPSPSAADKDVKAYTWKNLRLLLALSEKVARSDSALYMRRPETN